MPCGPYLLLLIAVGSVVHASESTRPNVLFLFTGETRADSLGARFPYQETARLSEKPGFYESACSPAKPHSKTP